MTTLTLMKMNKESAKHHLLHEKEIKTENISMLLVFIKEKIKFFIPPNLTDWQQHCHHQHRSPDNCK